MSPLVQLAKLEKATGSCVGGWLRNKLQVRRPPLGRMQRVWLARGVTNTCRNAGNYKTYIECTKAGSLSLGEAWNSIGIAPAWR
jgi:hypothetical protein